MQMIQLFILMLRATKEQAAIKLTAALNKVSDWLCHSCLILNMSTTVVFFFIFSANVCLMYKLFHDLAPPPLKQCVTFCKENIRQTRSSGDCLTKLRTISFFSLRSRKMAFNTCLY